MFSKKKKKYGQYSVFLKYQFSIIHKHILHKHAHPLCCFLWSVFKQDAVGKGDTLVQGIAI